MQEKLVSIIITTYGEPDKLNRAIDSCLNQTYKNIEIIVVDDNNPNTIARRKTERILEKYSQEPVIYLKHEKNKNGAAARNTGLSKAQGEYIAFLDSDDFYLKDRIQLAVSDIENSDNSVIAVCYNVVNIYRNQIRSVFRHDSDYVYNIESSLVDKNIGSGSNLFFRSIVLKQTGVFDVNLDRNQDIQFFIELLKNGVVKHLDRYVIIKDNGKGKNLNYEKTRKSYLFFDGKYDELISSYGSEYYLKYKIDRWESISQIAYYSSKSDNIKQSLNTLKKYRTLKLIEKFYLKFSVIPSIYYKIRNEVKYGKISFFIDFIVKKKYHNNEIKLMNNIGNVNCEEIRDYIIKYQQ